MRYHTSFLTSPWALGNESPSFSKAMAGRYMTRLLDLQNAYS